MQRALELAELGKGSVSPNPMVGCVIVHDNKIIGEGYHKKYGEAHAEVNAIASVTDHSLLPKSTIYVTLEPCAHFGKTPPCADLIISKKIKHVIIACLDPFEKVAGKGVQKLVQSGADVKIGTLESEAIELNNRFFTSIKKKRPYVILKWAQTKDGFVARENFDSKWISNEYSRQLVHKWRTEEDAILVGKNTALHDNPSLTAREWQGKNPSRVLLDTNLEVPRNSNLFNDQAPLLVFNSIKDETEVNVTWIKIDLNNPLNVLQKLHELNIQSIIIEGGAQTLNSFIDQNCWDEARVFTAQATFENGIAAPSVGGDLIHSETIFEDQLKIYKNNG
jgi:diaminohydroxyphosphoribosylaminopyrimidine deaminase / 5-amino-6-(5-phosphoribosylamino)uracil reductase